MREEKTKKYGDEDKICPHCGGNLGWHSLEEAGILKWCDKCGSNTPESPPNVEIVFTI